MITRGKAARDFVRIKSYGDRYKIVYFSRLVRMPEGVDPVPSGPREAAGDAGGRLANNLSRAKARVQELALCNQWDWFATFTLDGAKYQRDDLDRYRADLAQWLRNQRRLHGGDVRYLIIPEQHKDGAWHMHGLLSGMPAERLRPFDRSEVLPYAILAELDKGNQVYDWPGYRRKFGWVTLTRVRDKNRVASYITKYVTKSLTADTGVAAGKHLYYASRGLAGAEMIWEGVMNAAAVDWDWVGDYCKVKWVDADGLKEVFEHGNNLYD